MDFTNLSKIGLTQGEIKVYLALIKHGAQSKSHLANKANVSSSKVYEIAEKLIKKGLAGSFLKNNVTYYTATNPLFLKEYIEGKEKALRKEKKIVEEILPQLQSFKDSTEKEVSFELYEGWKGLQNEVSRALEITPKGSNVYGISIQFPQISFISNFYRKIKQKKIKLKMISTGKKEKVKTSKSIEIKHLPGISNIGMGLYPDRVLIQVLDGEPINLTIKHPKIVKSFKQIYDLLWKTAKP